MFDDTEAINAAFFFFFYNIAGIIAYIIFLLLLVGKGLEPGGVPRALRVHAK